MAHSTAYLTTCNVERTELKLFYNSFVYSPGFLFMLLKAVWPVCAEL